MTDKLIAEMYLQLKVLSIEIAQLRSIVSRTPLYAEGWATAEKAAAALQADGIKNPRHLQKLRLDGVFSESKGEIRNVSSGIRPTWEYHIPNCRTALQRHFKRLTS